MMPPWRRPGSSAIQNRAAGREHPTALTVNRAEGPSQRTGAAAHSGLSWLSVFNHFPPLPQAASSDCRAGRCGSAFTSLTTAAPRPHFQPVAPHFEPVVSKYTSARACWGQAGAEPGNTVHGCKRPPTATKGATACVPMQRQCVRGDWTCEAAPVPLGVQMDEVTTATNTVLLTTNKALATWQEILAGGGTTRALAVITGLHWQQVQERSSICINQPCQPGSYGPIHARRCTHGPHALPTNACTYSTRHWLCDSSATGGPLIHSSSWHRINLHVFLVAPL
jgi:hypothetical protein